MSRLADAMPATTLEHLTRDIRRQFSQAGVATPDIDARVLVGGILRFSATDMVVRGDTVISSEDRERLAEAVRRRLGGEPVYRILGSRPFFGLDLALSPATLEPRPDTEILVEAALPFVRAAVDRRGVCHIADMGTGTGAICLALLSQVPQARGTGVDISAEALETAAANARTNGLSCRFSTVESEWFSTLHGLFDVIVANPPYIRTQDIASLSREVREHDPRLALDGGEDGLRDYRILAAEAKDRIDEDGIVAVEFGHGQSGAVESIFFDAGYSALSHHDDLASHGRAAVFARRQAERKPDRE